MPEDCTACGTCCFSDLDRYVPVSGDDYQRLGGDAGAFVVFHGNKAFMRMAAGRCAALRLDGGRFLCAVYERRPDTCRNLARGSAECAGELFAKAERPREAQRLAALARSAD